MQITSPIVPLPSVPPGAAPPTAANITNRPLPGVAALDNAGNKAPPPPAGQTASPNRPRSLAEAAKLGPIALSSPDPATGSAGLVDARDGAQSISVYRRIANRVGWAAGSVASGFGMVAGMGTQLVNEVAERLMPGRVLVDADLIVLQGTGAVQRGAELVRLRFSFPNPAVVDFDALRETRPLLASITAEASGDGTPLRLAFDAKPAPGTDFGVAGRESTMLSVYIDGRYHSDLAVLAERPSNYSVNLAGLAAGKHAIELRAATDISGDNPPATVTQLLAKPMVGLAADVARHAPILETRYNPRLTGPTPEAAFTDLPLLMVPSVKYLEGGVRRISYDLLLSNEDNGLPVTTIFRNYGRSTDYEPVYSVDLDASGKRIVDRFQGPSHAIYDFSGERVGDRPVLRVGTRNNLFTSNLLGATPRWSEAPTRVYNGMAPPDRALMTEHPWTFSVMGKEIERENKVVPAGQTPGKGQVVDARQHLYFEPADAARTTIEQEKEIRLRMLDGSSVVVPVPGRSIWPTLRNRPPLGTAIPLPPSVAAADIAGVEGLAGRVLRLDAQYKPQALPGV